MEELIRTFDVLTAEGESRTLHAYRKLLDVGTREDPGAKAEGLKRLVTADGQSVNRLEKGRYQIVDTGEILTSSAPDAP